MYKRGVEYCSSSNSSKQLEGFSLIKNAAERHYRDAQEYLGFLFYVGGDYCASEDFDLSLIWNLKAAERGSVKSMRDASFLYFIKRDLKNANKWKKEAIRNGYKDGETEWWLD